MRSAYIINGDKLSIGPTNIVETLPQNGSFQPTRGRAITFAGVYTNTNNRAYNTAEEWQWNLVIEDEPLYNDIIALGYSGEQFNISTAFGSNISSPITYSGEVKDITLELIDNLTFKNNKRGYKISLLINAWS